MSVAGVAHPVERHLAKVEVASSSLVARSRKSRCFQHLLFCFPRLEQSISQSDGLWILAGLGGDTLRLRSKGLRASSTVPKEADTERVCFVFARLTGANNRLWQDSGTVPMYRMERKQEIRIEHDSGVFRRNLMTKKNTIRYNEKTLTENGMERETWTAILFRIATAAFLRTIPTPIISFSPGLGTGPEKRHHIGHPQRRCRYGRQKRRHSPLYAGTGRENRYFHRSSHQIRRFHHAVRIF